MKTKDYSLAEKKTWIKKVARHFPKNRNIGIRAIFSESGDPICDSEGMTDALVDYWGAKAKGEDYDEDFVLKTLKSFVCYFPVIQ